jgi:hypothetical protein
MEQVLLGALPTDDEPVPIMNENGNPLIFDFFGLGQQGMAPHQQGNNLVWGQNDGGEHVGKMI